MRWTEDEQTPLEFVADNISEVVKLKFEIRMPIVCTYVLLNLQIEIKALFYIDFTLFLLSNMAAFGSKFSRPNGMEDGVNKNYLEWHIFCMTDIWIDKLCSWEIRKSNISIEFIFRFSYPLKGRQWLGKSQSQTNSPLCTPMSTIFASSAFVKNTFGDHEHKKWRKNLKPTKLDMNY